MANRAKRSALSSTLVSIKETPAAQGPVASLSDAPRKGASAVPPSGVADQVLASKGAASASGFKPWYWSYEQEGEAAPAENTARVMPFPASTAAAALRDTVAPPTEMATSSIQLKTRQSTFVTKLLLGLACVALAVTAAPFLYSMSQPSGEPSLPVPATAVQAVSPAPAPALAPAPPALSEATNAAASAPTASPPPLVAEAPPSPPAPAPEPQAEAPRLSAQEIAEFLERGDQLLVTGDVSAARVFYERVAEQGSAKAAMSLAKTYDPLFLDRLPTRGVRSDIARALDWYRKAAAGGEAQAEAHIIRLTAKRAG